MRRQNIDELPGCCVRPRVGGRAKTLSPLFLKIGDLPQVALSQSGRASGGCREGLEEVGLSSLAEGDQALDVTSALGSEDDADRGHVGQRDTTPAQEDVNEGAADSPVAVREGVDRFKPVMHDTGIGPFRTVMQFTASGK